MVNFSQPTEPPEMDILAVPKELAHSIQEIIRLYEDPHQKDLIKLLQNLISIAKNNLDPNYLDPNNLESANDDEFLKSWDDIFNVQVYIDTDIFGELDPRPPALTEPERIDDKYETIIQHTEATEIYMQAWKELAQSMSSFPDDLFTRLWTTIELSNILECSSGTLRRARKNKSLPITIKDLVVDCISHDGKRSLWFVRPS